VQLAPFQRIGTSLVLEILDERIASSDGGLKLRGKSSTEY
jgi:hypothetical protein